MKRIQIVGGGLAGLSLGLALRQAGAPVTVIEAGRYPRHRVCGEFISGEGRSFLRELGLEEKFAARGAREARTAAFYAGRAGGAPRRLPEPALCLTRYAMDACLADEFRRAGGELAENTRWRDGFGPGIVRATGRAATGAHGSWRRFGLKAHVRHATLAADLEMHLVENGYVGLCRQNDGVVNVCGLFRSRAAEPDLAKNWRGWLEGPADSALRKRLAGAEFLEDSFCCAAGLGLEPRRAAERAECCVGDAITMIAPVTGNGMSMAFESARLARDPLLDYSRGRIPWEQARTHIAQRCDAAFRRRLVWGRHLQSVAFRRPWNEGAVWLGMRWPLLWRLLFARTR